MTIIQHGTKLQMDRSTKMNILGDKFSGESYILNDPDESVYIESSDSEYESTSTSSKDSKGAQDSSHDSYGDRECDNYEDSEYYEKCGESYNNNRSVNNDYDRDDHDDHDNYDIWASNDQYEMGLSVQENQISLFNNNYDDLLDMVDDNMDHNFKGIEKKDINIDNEFDQNKIEDFDMKTKFVALELFLKIRCGWTENENWTSETGENDCTICMDSMENCYVIIPPCHHVFHYECILEALKYDQRRCPDCKRFIKRNDVADDNYQQLS